mmetsp:Transcript_14986/g.21371  ORF Transcript_14986/g.21371 Transcript_14986/m.21371 type:complete len:202 (+) Transcript_14986:65-670(+)
MVGRLLLACYSLTALWQHFSRTTASLLATPTNDVSFNGPEASGNPEEMSGSVVVTEAEGLNLAADSISDNFGEELDLAVEEEEEWNTADMAAKKDDLSALKKIAESSYAKLFETDENLWQPIHEAARYGHFEVVDYLLAEGADINAHTSMDHTPLDVAIEYLGESHPIVKKLRDVGAVSGIIEHTDVADEYYAADEYYDEL